jgi:D-alanyl-D-alanine carboxypeptidase
MERRDFIKLLSMSLPVFACGCADLRHHLIRPKKLESPTAPLDDIGEVKANSPTPINNLANDIKTKSLHFDQNFPDDVYCPVHSKQIMDSLINKFRSVQNYVGFGNFNLVGMDEFFFHTKYAPRISHVTSAEKKFLDELFHKEAKELGFYGAKVFNSLTENIIKKNTVKIARSGHYLRKGKSVETYNKIVHDIGNTVILTSGVRGLAKQFHLFLEKTAISEGNFSKASRSLAPPGYSFHGQNDFDIGKVGLGLGNFSDDFASTREFKVLSDLGYVDIRYKEMNNLGVRFEPWHIKI